MASLFSKGGNYLKNDFQEKIGEYTQEFQKINKSIRNIDLEQYEIVREFVENLMTLEKEHLTAIIFRFENQHKLAVIASNSEVNDELSEATNQLGNKIEFIKEQINDLITEFKYSIL